MSAELVQVLLEATVKGAPLLVIAAAATWMLRGRSASVRHSTWVVAIVAAAAMPFISRVAPSWQVGLPGDVSSIVARVDAAIPPPPAQPQRVRIRMTAAAPAPTVRERAPISTSVQLPASPAQKSIAPVTMLAVGWLLVACAFIARLVASVVRVQRITQRARPVLDDSWSTLLAESKRALRTARTIRLVVSDETSTPLASGIIDPVIVLPPDSDTWTIELRRSVLLHEMAHVTRFDTATQVTTQLCCALYWFNPLMWVAARAVRHERERACDDCVLRAGTRASEYAAHLLGMASAIKANLRLGAGLAMARHSRIEQRLVAILDPSIPRGVTGRAPRIALGALATAIAIPVASLRVAPIIAGTPDATVYSVPSTMELTAALSVASPGRETGRTRRAAASRVTPKMESVPAITDDVAMPAVSDTGGVCHETRRVRPHSSGYASMADQLYILSRFVPDSAIPRFPTENKGIHAGTWRGPDCSASYNFTGHVKFDSDYSDVTHVALSDVRMRGGPAAYVDLSAVTNGVQHRLVIQVPGGIENRLYTVGGRPQPYDDNARGWMRAMLVGVDRHTARGIDARLPALLKQGGATAVLDEIDQIPTDYARAVYYLELIRATALSVTDIRRITNTVTTLSTDYSIWRVLDALTTRYSPMNAEIRAAVRDAAMSIQGMVDRDDIMRRAGSS